MTREVKVLVTLQADYNENEISLGEIQTTCADAVANAVDFASMNGFVHPRADSVLIGVADVEVAT